MSAAVSGAPQHAGTWQGVTLIAVAAMPVLALSGLVADLPLLFRQFAGEAHHELLVPMIITVPSLCVAVFSGGAGYIADRWGRRPLLLISLLAFSILGLMPLLFGNLRNIIASRVVVGLSEAAILTTANALLGDYFGEQERRRWLGYQNIFGSLFGSAVILAGGFLADWHWRAPFLLYLIGFVVLALAWRHCWEPAPTVAKDAPITPPAGFPWRTAAFVCGVTLALSSIYFVQAVQHGRIFGDLGVASPARISMLVTAASMGTILGGYLFKRFTTASMQTLLACSLLAYGIAYLGVAWAPNAAVGLPLDALGQLGGGIMLPTLIAWSLGKYDFGHRGRGMGLWGGAFFLGAFVSPPLVTLVGQFTRNFLASVGVAGALCLLIAVLIMLMNGRAPPGDSR
jgi:MFS family permease